MSAVPLAQAKAHLNITDASQDAEVQRQLDAAEAWVSDRTGPLVPTTITERLTVDCGRLVLSTTPILSLAGVSALSPWDGSTTTTYDVGTFYVDVAAGVVELRRVPFALISLAGAYQVTYQAGRTTVPADLVQAVLDVLKALWLLSQRGAAVRGGGVPIPFPPPSVPGLIADHERIAW